MAMLNNQRVILTYDKQDKWTESHHRSLQKYWFPASIRVIKGPGYSDWCVLRRDFSGMIHWQLSISSSQQPPATHPATLRKTYQ